MTMRSLRSLWFRLLVIATVMLAAPAIIYQQPWKRIGLRTSCCVNPSRSMAS